MSSAGFVLAGGKSTRMGRDKALLPFNSTRLIEAVAGRVQAAAGSVTLIGAPASYADFGYPVRPDLFPGCGPLGGLHAALSLRLAPWNLVAACDMPNLDTVCLSSLVRRAVSIAEPERTCVVPLTEAGELEPLCAVYHSSCLLTVERVLSEGRFKMKVLLAELSCIREAGYPARIFANINTPDDWNEVNAR